MKPTPKRAAAATVVRLSMTEETHQPSVVDTLRWGDAARKAAVRISGGSSPVLSGIDPRTDKPFADPKHPRAFYIPADEDGDGGLDVLTIWDPSGLSEDDVYALASMRNLRARRRSAYIHRHHRLAREKSARAEEKPAFISTIWDTESQATSKAFRPCSRCQSLGNRLRRIFLPDTCREEANTA